jgi:hypothetical protein
MKGHALNLAAVAAVAYVAAGSSTINPPLRITNADPDGNAVMVTNNSQASSSLAASFVSTNANDTTVGVRGRETGRGTLKVTNERQDGRPNVNAAAASLSLEALGSEPTNAQGIFLNAPGQGTTGKLLNLRNQGVERFVVGPDGALTLQGVRLFVNEDGELVAVTRNGSTVIAG